MQRGSTVSFRGRVGVVWAVTPTGLILLPVQPGPPLTRADVPVTGLADRLAVLALAASCIRAGYPLAARPQGQERIGELTPELVAIVAAAMARAAADAGDAAKWESERLHRRRAWAITR